MFITTNQITAMHIHCSWGPSQEVRSRWNVLLFLMFSRSLAEIDARRRQFDPEGRVNLPSRNGWAESAEIQSAFHFLRHSSMKPWNASGNREPVSACFSYFSKWHKLWENCFPHSRLSGNFSEFHNVPNSNDMVFTAKTYIDGKWIPNLIQNGISRFVIKTAIDSEVLSVCYRKKNT